MNNRHLLSLLQNNFRTVHVVFGAEMNYEQQAPASSINASVAPWDQPAPKRGQPQAPVPSNDFAQVPQKAYVYKCHNDLAVEVGSAVVVMRDNGQLTLATAVRIDDFADIDLSAEYNYKWIVDVVSTDLYSGLLKKEADFNRLVTEAQRAKLREETLQSFKSVLPTEGEAAKLFHEAFNLFDAKLADGDDGK